MSKENTVEQSIKNDVDKRTKFSIYNSKINNIKLNEEYCDNDDNFEKLEQQVKRGESFDLIETLVKINQPIDIQNQYGMTLLHLACKNIQQDSIRVLLQAGADPNEKDELGKSSLHWVLDIGCHCQHCSTKAYKCMEHLLDYGANVNAVDNNGETPLKYAAKSMLPKCALELIDRGAEIIFENTRNCIRYLLNERMPEVLVRLLDKAITFDEKENSKLKLEFGWLYETSKNGLTTTTSPLYPTNAKVDTSRFSEITFLVQLAKGDVRGKKALLTHPWIQAFLHLKWLAVRKWFWALRFIYGFFIAFYTFFIFQIYIRRCPYSKFYMKTNPNENITGSWNDNGDKIEEEPICEQNILMTFCGVIGIICVILMVLNEFFELKMDIKEYLTNYLNILWWLLIISLILTLLPAFGMTPHRWHYPVAAFGLFYTWAMNLTQISRRPFYGEYIEMLGKVLENFFIFLSTFISIIIAFTLGMCVMFPQNEFFKSIPLGFVKVIIIMIGEADYEGLFKENHYIDDLEYSIPAHVMYIGFIGIITIVLTNLLLGLAVSDIQELRKISSITRITRQITQISILESFINSSTLIVWFASIIFPSSTVEITIGRSVTFSPLNPHDKLLPENLKRKFIPYLTSCPCLNKNKRLKLKNMLAPIRWNNYAKTKASHDGKDKEDTCPGLNVGEVNKKITEAEQIRIMLRSMSENMIDLKDQLEKISNKIDRKFC